MLELLTLYPHVDYMADAAYSSLGGVDGIVTEREPEYDEKLRNLIYRCIEPYPQGRIGLRDLQLSVLECRNRIRSAYRNLDEAARTQYKADNRLYYVNNEINEMPTGNWIPGNPKSPSEPESGKFPDREFPVHFPRFEKDGPEAEVEYELYPDDYWIQQQPGAPDGRARTGKSTYCD